jgi:hypothetical protein
MEYKPPAQSSVDQRDVAVIDAALELIRPYEDYLPHKMCEVEMAYVIGRLAATTTLLIAVLNRYLPESKKTNG